MGVKSVPIAKSKLLEELDGFVVPFDSKHLEKLLSKACSMELCQQYLDSGSNKVYHDKSWINLPQHPKNEKKLYKPLKEIIQDINKHFGADESSHVYGMHNKEISSENAEGLKSKPNLIITGSGQHFRGKITTKEWSQCLSVVEVKKEAEELEEEEEEEEQSEAEVEAEKSEMEEELDENGDGDKVVDHGLSEKRAESEEQEQRAQIEFEKQALAQLAFYTRQLLSEQPTRNFVYNIIITERRVRLFSFDRVGVQYSNWFDYHTNPERLVQMICLVTSSDLESLGLDMTVVFPPEKQGSIRFTLQHEGKDFVVTGNVKPRFHSLGLRGRSTVCWSVQDELGNSYLLKQQFISTNQELEHTFMAQMKGPSDDRDVRCLGTYLFFQLYDKVSEARGMTTVPPEFRDRYMYRVLLKEHGDTIDTLKGKTQLDLLVAIRDAIIGHRNLFLTAVLHRDISTNNILYRNGGPDDDSLRGVLIDFDLAINILSTESLAAADFRTGTRAFQSICVLLSDFYSTSKNVRPENAPPTVALHDHLDDLESFFWVLFWITRQHVAPGTDAKLLQPGLQVRQDLEADVMRSASSKMSYLDQGYSGVLHLQDGWSKPVNKLVQRLAAAFDEKSRAKRRKNRVKPSTAQEIIDDAPENYDEVLDLFDTAIKELKEEIPGMTNLTGDSHTRTSSKRSREPETQDGTCDDKERGLSRPLVKRLRVTKLESALPRRTTRAAARKELQLQAEAQAQAVATAAHVSTLNGGIIEDTSAARSRVGIQHGEEGSGQTTVTVSRKSKRHTTATRGARRR